MHLPAILWPVAIRRRIETDILILLASELATELRWLKPTGFVAVPSDYREAERVALRLAGFSPREASESPFATDREQAFGLAQALSEAEASHHLGYLEAVARAVIWVHRECPS